jgi:hypothetical protein
MTLQRLTEIAAFFSLQNSLHPSLSMFDLAAQCGKLCLSEDPPSFFEAAPQSVDAISHVYYSCAAKSELDKSGAPSFAPCQINNVPTFFRYVVGR